MGENIPKLTQEETQHLNGLIFVLLKKVDFK